MLDARVRLGADGPELRFAATHLEHAQATARVCQAGKLSPLILGSSSPLPAILAGDFNNAPDSATRKVLLAHWTDTTDERAEPTFPADKPQRKLDYVFFQPASRWRVVETQVVFEPVASDHCPLLVVLQWLR